MSLRKLTQTEAKRLFKCQTIYNKEQFKAIIEDIEKYSNEDFTKVLNMMGIDITQTKLRIWFEFFKIDVIKRKFDREKIKKYLQRAFVVPRDIDDNTLIDCAVNLYQIQQVGLKFKKRE